MNDQAFYPVNSPTSADRYKLVPSRLDSVDDDVSGPNSPHAPNEEPALQDSLMLSHSPLPQQTNSYVVDEDTVRLPEEVNKQNMNAISQLQPSNQANQSYQPNRPLYMPASNPQQLYRDALGGSSVAGTPLNSSPPQNVPNWNANGVQPNTQAANFYPTPDNVSYLSGSEPVGQSGPAMVMLNQRPHIEQAQPQQFLQTPSAINPNQNSSPQQQIKDSVQIPPPNMSGGHSGIPSAKSYSSEDERLLAQEEEYRRQIFQRSNPQASPNQGRPQVPAGQMQTQIQQSGVSSALAQPPYQQQTAQQNYPPLNQLYPNYPGMQGPQQGPGQIQGQYQMPPQPRPVVGSPPKTQQPGQRKGHGTRAGVDKTNGGAAEGIPPLDFNDIDRSSMLDFYKEKIEIDLRDDASEEEYSDRTIPEAGQSSPGGPPGMPPGMQNQGQIQGQRPQNAGMGQPPYPLINPNAPTANMYPQGFPGKPPLPRPSFGPGQVMDNSQANLARQWNSLARERQAAIQATQQAAQGPAKMRATTRKPIPLSPTNNVNFVELNRKLQQPPNANPKSYNQLFNTKLTTNSSPPPAQGRARPKLQKEAPKEGAGVPGAPNSSQVPMAVAMALAMPKSEGMPNLSVEELQYWHQIYITSFGETPSPEGLLAMAAQHSPSRSFVNQFQGPIPIHLPHPSNLRGSPQRPPFQPPLPPQLMQQFIYPQMPMRMPMSGPMPMPPYGAMPPMPPPEMMMRSAPMAMFVPPMPPPMPPSRKAQSYSHPNSPQRNPNIPPMPIGPPGLAQGRAMDAEYNSYMARSRPPQPLHQMAHGQPGQPTRGSAPVFGSRAEEAAAQANAMNEPFTVVTMNPYHALPPIGLADPNATNSNPSRSPRQTASQSLEYDNGYKDLYEKSKEPITYKPRTLHEWRNLKQFYMLDRNNMTHTLGQDFESPEFKERMNKRHRQVNYARRVNKDNIERLIDERVHGSPEAAQTRVMSLDSLAKESGMYSSRAGAGTISGAPTGAGSAVSANNEQAVNAQPRASNSQSRALRSGKQERQPRASSMPPKDSGSTSSNAQQQPVPENELSKLDPRRTDAEAVEARIALSKRKMAIDYSKRVRDNAFKKGVPQAPPRKTDEIMMQPAAQFTYGTYSNDLDQFDTKLEELQRRHEADKQRAETIRERILQLGIEA